MSDDRSTIAIDCQSFAAIVDAVQRAIIDKGASKATRKAAFSALLALVEAGLVIGDASIGSPASESVGSPASEKKSPVAAPVSAHLRLLG